MRRFNLKFHRLNSSSFAKLSVFVWACRSQGVAVDIDAFPHTHRVHYQPRKVAGEAEVSVCQFGVYTFCYRAGVEVPAQAQMNKWKSPWLKHWFYYKLGGEGGVTGDLCGVLTPHAMQTAEGAGTSASDAAVDALRLLGRNLCARKCFVRRCVTV
jgi:hypothetical protein